jgi:hypothetical protein
MSDVVGWFFCGVATAAMFALCAWGAIMVHADQRKHEEDVKKRRAYRIFVACETIRSMPREAPAYVVRRTTEGASSESNIAAEAARALGCLHSALIAELVDGIWGDYEPGKTIYLHKYAQPGYALAVRAKVSATQTAYLRINDERGNPTSINGIDAETTYLRVITARDAAGQATDESALFKNGSAAELRGARTVRSLRAVADWDEVTGAPLIAKGADAAAGQAM